MNRGKRYQSKRKRGSGSRFKTGIYIPINEKKYRQPSDTTMSKSALGPTYRSSWEKAFMEYCDASENVVMWGVEPFPIMYLSPKDNKMHRYYIDIVMKMKNGQKHLIEIKPKSQCNQPINLAKWEAARMYCSKIGAIFTVVTEVELKAWGLIK